MGKHSKRASERKSKFAIELAKIAIEFVVQIIASVIAGIILYGIIG